MDAADYNRTSFYRYYSGKEQLARDIVDYLEELILQSLAAGKQEYRQKQCTVALAVYRCILKNHEFFDLLVADDTLPGLESGLLQCLARLYSTEEFVLCGEGRVLEGDYARAFRAYGTMGFIKAWIKSGYQADYREIARQIDQLLTAAFHWVEA